jgi:hypothetical protein
VDPTAVRLSLKVDDGEEGLLKPKSLIFNANGLENVQGLRNAQDGITHFGSKKLREEGKSHDIFNDYIFEASGDCGGAA